MERNEVRELTDKLDLTQCELAQMQMREGFILASIEELKESLEDYKTRTVSRNGVISYIENMLKQLNEKY